LLSIPFWRHRVGAPPIIVELIILGIATAGVMWSVALVKRERRNLLDFFGEKLKLSFAKS
jgi:hypothetical protein